MKILQPKSWRPLLIAFLCMVTCLTFVTICRAAELHYTEILPQGWTAAYATGIDSLGSQCVVGYGNDGTTNKGFIICSGSFAVMVAIILPPGWLEAYATGVNVNAMGLIGYGKDALGVNKGFFYSGETFIELLPSGWSEAYATGINDSGIVVGYGTDGAGVTKGFVYSGGSYSEVLPPGWNNASATGINNSGVMVGYGKDAAGENKGFIYSASIYSDLLPSGWSEAYATGVNDSGVVIGYGKDGAGVTKGFVYSSGTYVALLPSGWISATASGINNTGKVVGWANDGTITQGFVYDEGTYRFLLPDGWVESHATAINDDGDVVVGYGMDADYAIKGFIVRIAIPFDIQIMKIIDFFDSSIKDGTLYGVKKGNGAEKKLNKFKQMLVDIQYLIWDGNIADACQELNDAYKRADGIKPPADYVTGPSVNELETMMEVLINDMCMN